MPHDMYAAVRLVVGGRRRPRRTRPNSGWMTAAIGPHARLTNR